MNYSETIDYLYSRFPAFQKIGGSAYKPGLENSHRLDALCGHPHRHYPIIHVAGTNGKGSVSHTTAAILQAAGYRVGLYTSPHLVDFRERIRVNGGMIPQERVVQFVDNYRESFEEISPSFFEYTMLMAFDYFASEKVDVAVIEVGLGGRLDSTNIVSSQLSVITNISFDHVQFLGNSYESIAREKGGIIKEETPVVIGEYMNESYPVFEEIARRMRAPLYRAWEESPIDDFTPQAEGGSSFVRQGSMIDRKSPLYFQLGGEYQAQNLPTILTVVDQLRRLGYSIAEESLRQGLAHVKELTGLRGRWEVIRTPQGATLIADTGHNEAGIRQITRQLDHLRSSSSESFRRPLSIVWGVVSDKDVRSMLALLPKDARYYFTQASVHRALPADELAQLASGMGLKGEVVPNVPEAVEQAIRESMPDSLIFVGGSSFIVADYLAAIDQKRVD